jgi:hypothetical protein
MLVVIFLAVLQGWAKGHSKPLLLLPLLTLLWTNVHASFPLALLVIAFFFAGGCISQYSEKLRRKPKHANGSLAPLGAAWVGCFAATFLNPYGYHLYAHIYRFLSTPALVDQNAEFGSPNFHHAAPRLFLMLIVLLLAGLANPRRSFSVTDLLLVLFAVSSGLYAIRNVPVSAILLTYVTAPLLQAAIQDGCKHAAGFLQRACSLFDDVANNAKAVETQSRGHLLAFAATIMTLAFALLDGSNASMRNQFPAQFPATAVDTIQNLGIHDHLFAPDQWGSYLIYRLYPGFKVFLDDRSDFYGPTFVRDYQTLALVEPGWEDILKRHGVRYVLMPPSSALVTVLSRTPGWSVVYRDSTAVLLKQ